MRQLSVRPGHSERPPPWSSARCGREGPARGRGSGSATASRRAAAARPPASRRGSPGASAGWGFAARPAAAFPRPQEAPPPAGLSPIIGVSPWSGERGGLATARQPPPNGRRRDRARPRRAAPAGRPRGLWGRGTGNRQAWTFPLSVKPDPTTRHPLEKRPDHRSLPLHPRVRCGRSMTTAALPCRGWTADPPGRCPLRPASWWSGLQP
jgi:hypothetical protein